MDERYKFAWLTCVIAVTSLASGSAPLPQRLSDAFKGALYRIKDEDLPEPTLRATWADIRERLTNIKPTTPDPEATKLAQAVVGFADSISRRFAWAG